MINRNDQEKTLYQAAKQGCEASSQAIRGRANNYTFILVTNIKGNKKYFVFFDPILLAPINLNIV